MHDLTAPLMPLYRVKFWYGKDRSSSFGGKQPALRVDVVGQRISSNISGCAGPIFANFSPYERALRADDISVPYFPFCQRTLLWQPSNFAIMKANCYYVHSLHVRQMVERFHFATTC